jgi:hypothetical protein
MGRRGAALTRIARAAGIVAALAAGGLAAGCVQRTTLYDWGTYQESLYELWCEPGSATPAETLERLTEELTAARAAGRVPPPGLQAHLGYLQLIAGNGGAAVSWFQEEEETYPESAVFMDRLIAKVTQKPAQAQTVPQVPQVKP